MLGFDVDEVDWLIDAAEHDLLDDIIYQRLLDDVKAKKYDGSLSGTPCDTFSAARQGDDDDPDGAPRPLRSIEEPYGFRNERDHNRRERVKQGTRWLRGCRSPMLTITKSGEL